VIATPYDDLQVHDRNGNVFQDIELPDADDRLAKAELAHTIRNGGPSMPMCLACSEARAMAQTGMPAVADGLGSRRGSCRPRDRASHRG